MSENIRNSFIKREIKFRAWHKEENFMLEPKYIKHMDWNDETIYYIGGNYRGYEIDNIYKGEVNYLWKGDRFVDKNENVCDVLFDEIELMQYAGLKDKNGIEIYEGDIIKYDFNDLNYRIEFVNAEFIARRFYENIENLYPAEFDYGKECKVIGNIYENPELLKGEI